MKKIILLLLLAGTVAFGQEVISGRSNTLTLGASPTASLGLSKFPKYHAVIIGVSDYKHSGPGLSDLDQPVKDADKLYSILTKKYAFEVGDVTLLKNPTREDIINKLDDLATQVTEKENLLIFYAGHGYFDKAKELGFWLPADAKTTSRSNWIANSTIKDYINAIPAKHTFLITDACFGGSIFKTRSVESFVEGRVYELYRDKSRKAMTSGNLTEVADESVFLKFLIKVLEENQQPFLSASSLFIRLYEPVLNNAASTPQFGVIQSTGDEGGDFIFIRKDE